MMFCGFLVCAHFYRNINLTDGKNNNKQLESLLKSAITHGIMSVEYHEKPIGHTYAGHVGPATRPW